ncbi:uncharacterized protein LOC110860701 [Folsomia candida]|uniref:DUF389 domain-containing protein n=1 Tax=Folsomia candida TaxID=158441 RepID=A0A226D5W3_FOLCA|nr:uncharacterized protein LOC110860701 [Folsomia candida]OXA40543.1 hypothetical protein Fcan01_24769 [Folsomia candida]
MGSLFMVVVPIRDHEALLRQKEHRIQVIEAGSIDRAEFLKENGGGLTIHVPSGEEGPSSGSTNATLASSAGTIRSHSTGGNEVDVYTALADGAPVRVVVSGDSMAIIGAKQGDLDEHFGKMMERKKKSAEDAEELAIQDAIDNIFLEKHLEECLAKYDIMNACWGQSVDGNYSQVSFTVSADRSEVIIKFLQTVGIGKRHNSTICVCASSVYYEPETGNQKDNEKGSEDPNDPEGKKGSKWVEDFVASIKSRLTVAQVVQSVKANAILTFDYIVLILVAGMIAGLGLVDDSAVNVVASMLVSPLMGPIMAMTFGAVIRDWQLVRIGIISELVGLLLCLLVGFIFGILLQVPGPGGPWDKIDQWPTPQMVARSETRALIVGVLVAIPSGAGVALSILAGNSGSLVGVAISASLLPPAVNCGILWGLATVVAITERYLGFPPENLGCNSHLKALATQNYTHNHVKIYCENTVQEYFFMGLNSFGLTWINIGVIIVVGVLILKIKEVAPHTTRQSLSRFWKQDLKIVRDLNSMGKNGTGSLMADLEESGKVNDILKNLETDQTFSAVNRRANYNILNDVRQRKQFGSTEDVTGGQNAESTPKSGGWFGGWFGGGATNEADNAKSVEEGQGKRNRPKLM